MDRSGVNSTTLNSIPRLLLSGWTVGRVFHTDPKHNSLKIIKPCNQVKYFSQQAPYKGHNTAPYRSAAMFRVSTRSACQRRGGGGILVITCRSAAGIDFVRDLLTIRGLTNIRAIRFFLGGQKFVYLTCLTFKWTLNFDINRCPDENWPIFVFSRIQRALVIVFPANICFKIIIDNILFLDVNCSKKKKTSRIII